MVFVDNFSAIALGDAVDPAQAVIKSFKCESAVTKGQLVIFNTHTAEELPSVSTAGAAATNVLGVAMKTGAPGETIPVLVKGYVKVKCAGAITGGVLVVAGASGTVDTIGSNTFEKVVGRAVQTFASADDYGIIAFGYP
jgi:hypothetical protein